MKHWDKISLDWKHISLNDVLILFCCFLATDKNMGCAIRSCAEVNTCPPSHTKTSKLFVEEIGIDAAKSVLCAADSNSRGSQDVSSSIRSTTAMLTSSSSSSCSSSSSSTSSVSLASSLSGSSTLSSSGLSRRQLHQPDDENKSDEAQTTCNTAVDVTSGIL